MSKIRPLGNRVLVKRAEAKTTKGGIILPDTAQEKPKEGTVCAVGPGRRDEDGHLQPMTVKIGDRVLFTTYAGTEVKHADEDYLLIAEDDLLGILS